MSEHVDRDSRPSDDGHKSVHLYRVLAIVAASLPVATVLALFGLTRLSWGMAFVVPFWSVWSAAPFIIAARWAPSLARARCAGVAGILVTAAFWGAAVYSG